MGLDIGIMKVECLERPGGRTYEFAQHMAEESVPGAYMFGERCSWIPFTQRQVLELLDVFAARRSLSAVDRRLVIEWLMELPWIGGWRDALPPDDGRDSEDGYHAVMDSGDLRDGGLIELHFSW